MVKRHKGVVVAVCLVFALGFAGCLGSVFDSSTKLVVKVDNRGSRSLPTTLDVKGPDNATLFHETFETAARSVVERTIKLPKDGTYTVEGTWPGAGGEGVATLTEDVDTVECPALNEIVVTLPVDASSGITVGPSRNTCDTS